MSSRDVRGIWEAYEGETELQYRRFRDYLAMNPRNIADLARIYGIESSGLYQLSKKRDWVRRAAAYDRMVAAELQRSALSGTLLAIDSDQLQNKQWLEEYEKMRTELWNARQLMLTKVKKMLDFEVGVSVKSARKTYRIKNPATKQYEVHTASEIQTDPRWSWGDTARMLDVIDRLGKEVLGLSPDMVELLPEFIYEARRHDLDPVQYLRRTIEKLKAL